MPSVDRVSKVPNWMTSYPVSRSSVPPLTFNMLLPKVSTKQHRFQISDWLKPVK